ncbi:hypothetical protein QTP70_007332 [Hemibagrus guttatus]|uniref:Uncharacterized protein n=1 Tax=Hemibagrus guttatus TaxID=175788 RepID=A0AAE0UMM9_9TELE|nr:hypothetical protein QTP70_007332 [Hemibagrus guttatus]KAK3532092.1 hypothetical protein QTP86_007870 [Hemibagrus guttatus]
MAVVVNPGLDRSVLAHNEALGVSLGFGSELELKTNHQLGGSERRAGFIALWNLMYGAEFGQHSPLQSSDLH